MRVETEWPDKPASVGCISDPLVIHKGMGKDQTTTLVMFVHGLGGDRYGTWGSFPSFLLNDVPAIDVGLYGYRTLISRLKFAASVELDLEAVVLADTLRDCLGYHRVIMIGHSMGGLLCKAAVKELIDRNDASTLARLKGLFLLATPQAGSLWAVPFLSSMSKDLRALSPHGALIERVNRTFTDHVTDKSDDPGKIYLPVFAIAASEDAWVSILSSGLSIPSAHRKVVRGSHTRIVKPSSRDDDVYQWVLARVRRLASSTENPDSPRTSAGAETLASSALDIPRFVTPFGKTKDKWKALERQIAFGRYELVEWIGYGGTGAVFRARDVTVGRQVAVKVFYAVPPQAIDLLRQVTARSVRGLAALMHPNLQRMLDHGIHSTSSSDSSLFIVSDFIPGRTLEDVLRRTSLSRIEDRGFSDKASSEDFETKDLIHNVLLAKQIASGLYAAHSSTFIGESGFQEHGVCHGDITPRNILIDGAGHPTIIDFMMPDLQRLIAPREQFTQGQQSEEDVYGWHYSNGRYFFRCPPTGAYGTPGFMPPEQSMDGVVTPLSDIYTMGLTFGLLFFKRPGPDDRFGDASWGGQQWHFSRIGSELAPSHLRDPYIRIAEMIDSMTRVHPNDRVQDVHTVEAFLVDMEHRLRNMLPQPS